MEKNIVKSTDSHVGSQNNNNKSVPFNISEVMGPMTDESPNQHGYSDRPSDMRSLPFGNGNSAAVFGKSSSSVDKSKGVELESESGVEDCLEMPKKVVSTAGSDRMLRSFNWDLNSRLTTNVKPLPSNTSSKISIKRSGQYPL